ncbi:hypothetical protein EPN90_05015 [Patescibacteria group bacterium]|nr:MAG: hypothetical protein EPN90_05015 [Patescibacteria group bacterium]
MFISRSKEENVSYICLSVPLDLLAPGARRSAERFAEIARVTIQQHRHRVIQTRRTPDLMVVRNAKLLVVYAVVCPAPMLDEHHLANGLSIPIVLLWPQGHPCARAIRKLPQVVEFREWETPGKALEHLKRFLGEYRDFSGEPRPRLAAAETSDWRQESDPA